MQPLRHPARAGRGFTLVEVVVAIVLLAIGVLGLASTAAVVTRQLARANLQTLAAVFARSRVDSLLSSGCHALASGGTSSGSAFARGVHESWVVSDGHNLKTISDTVRFEGRGSPLVFQAVVPCHD